MGGLLDHVNATPLHVAKLDKQRLRYKILTVSCTVSWEVSLISCQCIASIPSTCYKNEVPA